MATATLIAIAASIVLLYLLIKGHLYVTRELWEPVFEEELVEGEQSPDGDPGSDEEPGDGSDAEPGVEREPVGWDEVG